MSVQENNNAVAVPETKEKITDRALNKFVTCSVLSILLCLVCLCSTTFAWFSDSQTQANNHIQSAERCLLSIALSKEGTEISEDLEAGVELEAGTYQVTLTLPKDSASGYCQIIVDDVTYVSDFIARHEDDTPKTLSFDLVVNTTKTVKFVEHWGIYTRDSDVVSGVLTIG